VGAGKRSGGSSEVLAQVGIGGEGAEGVGDFLRAAGVENPCIRAVPQQAAEVGSGQDNRFSESKKFGEFGREAPLVEKIGGAGLDKDVGGAEQSEHAGAVDGTEFDDVGAGIDAEAAGGVFRAEAGADEGAGLAGLVQDPDGPVEFTLFLVKAPVEPPVVDQEQCAGGD
jgi:hypothetical protein